MVAGTVCLADAIQLAVLAESLEATFYKQAAAKFTAADFAAAGYADGQAVLDSIK